MSSVVKLLSKIIFSQPRTKYFQQSMGKSGLKNWGLVRPYTLGCSSYLLTVVSHGLCSVQVCKRERARELCIVSSDKDTKLLRLGPQRSEVINLNYYFLTGPSPIEPHWRLSLQHMNLGVGGDTNIQSITIT